MCVCLLTDDRNLLNLFCLRFHVLSPAFFVTSLTPLGLDHNISVSSISFLCRADQKCIQYVSYLANFSEIFWRSMHTLSLTLNYSPVQYLSLFSRNLRLAECMVKCSIRTVFGFNAEYLNCSEPGLRHWACSLTGRIQQPKWDAVRLSSSCFLLELLQ